jgi:hypothetical protein
MALTVIAGVQTLAAAEMLHHLVSQKERMTAKSGWGKQLRAT